MHLNQRQKCIEHLRGERHRLSLPQKDTLSFVDAKLAELVEVLGPLDHCVPSQLPKNFLRESLGLDAPSTVMVGQGARIQHLTAAVRSEQTMNQLLKLALVAITFCAAAFGQTSILAIDIENIVVYNQDTADVTKWASIPEKTDPLASQNFVPIIWLADVVAVNGVPAKGTWTVRGTTLVRSTTLTPGQAVADSGSFFFFDWIVDLILPDGRQVGTIMATGWGGALKPPGAP